jgi:chromosome segregation ATPase
VSEVGMARGRDEAEITRVLGEYNARIIALDKKLNQLARTNANRESHVQALQKQNLQFEALKVAIYEPDADLSVAAEKLGQIDVALNEITSQVDPIIKLQQENEEKLNKKLNKKLDAVEKKNDALQKKINQAQFPQKIKKDLLGSLQKQANTTENLKQERRPLDKKAYKSAANKAKAIDSNLNKIRKEIKSKVRRYNRSVELNKKVDSAVKKIEASQPGNLPTKTEKKFTALVKAAKALKCTSGQLKGRDRNRKLRELKRIKKQVKSKVRRYNRSVELNERVDSAVERVKSLKERTQSSNLPQETKDKFLASLKQKEESLGALKCTSGQLTGTKQSKDLKKLGKTNASFNELTAQINSNIKRQEVRGEKFKAQVKAVEPAFKTLKTSVNQSNLIPATKDGFTKLIEQQERRFEQIKS